jgi:hypothetical protein
MAESIAINSQQSYVVNRHAISCNREISGRMGVLLDAVLRTHFAAEVIATANRADIASEKNCKK